jgi:hypothetical protein
MDVDQDAAATRCSALSADRGEPLAGSASVATTWLCVEQPGPWGRDALLESHLDSHVGRELVERAKGTGVRTVLIRRPGSHPDRHRPVPRRVYLAHTAPGRTWLERAEVADPKELLDLDFSAAGAGNPTGIGELVTAPLLLMCTNGRRDVCCALRGRPIAEMLAWEHPELVWECTHLGGHRFSPTGLALPTGYSYGRLDVSTALRLLGNEVMIECCRGRSTWSAPGQVAELAVRVTINDRDPDSLLVDVRSSGEVLVSHVDGRAWRVRVTERLADGQWPASCGADPKPAPYLEAAPVQQL